MNVILLSGGSGKRLWPLSNQTRSKQFLKLIENEDGKVESMVQRIFRQLRKADERANIVVATSALQQDSIKSQLGGEVEIVLEPERRDTFPAVVLSCAYFVYEKGCSLDETAVILPVDPYAETAYFDTLAKLDEAARKGTAELMLMAINPTYPSEKYGYILPETQNGELRMVRHFEEKPTLRRAQELISQGAFWNGGVFAFRFRYVMELARRYLQFDSYSDLRSRYCELPKASFDREVVEKAASLGMIPYNGKWKDLGTWNTLTEQMQNSRIGNVVVGEETESTHVINELDIPLVVLGAKNMVVAASPDGILVSEKGRSSFLKPYVDSIAQRPMFEEHGWGRYKVLEYAKYGSGMHSLTKHILIRAGETVGYQRHSQRDEICTFVDGTGEMALDQHVRNIRRGDTVYVPAGSLHAIRAATDLHMIEIQIGEELLEEDRVYKNWDW